MNRSDEYDRCLLHTNCLLAKHCCTMIDFVKRCVVIEEASIFTVGKLSVLRCIRFINRRNTSLWNVFCVLVGGMVSTTFVHAEHFSYFDSNMGDLISQRLTIFGRLFSNLKHGKSFKYSRATYRSIVTIRNFNHFERLANLKQNMMFGSCFIFYGNERWEAGLLWKWIQPLDTNGWKLLIRYHIIFKS